MFVGRVPHPGILVVARGNFSLRQTPSLRYTTRCVNQTHTQPDAGPVFRKVCHFTGRVQGVGFRYTVHNLAMPHDVRGYVRNLPDGRVELVMEGPPGDMDQLLDSIRRKMNHFIRRVDTQQEPPTNAFTGFSIKH